jgi:hypothetical protein
MGDPRHELQQREPIALGEAARSGLTRQDHQLLAEESVFGESLDPAARQVCQCIGEGVGERGMVGAPEELMGGAG